MELNKKILNYIKEKDIIQSDLSKKLGYTQANLSRILNSNDIKFSQLEKICDALSLPVLHFIDNSNSDLISELEGYKKRIKELELLVNVNRRIEIERYYNTLQQILREDFKSLSDDIKKKVYEEISASVNTFDVFEEMSNRIILQVSEMSMLDIKKHIEETIVNIRARKIHFIKSKKNS